MAHTCPVCSQYCTCQGDWDDIDFGEWIGCIHCPELCEDDCSCEFKLYEDDEEFHDWISEENMRNEFEQ